VAAADVSLNWIRRGAAAFALVVGWTFISWQNRWHLTAPLVIICLGYLTVVSTVYFLWRTGTTAAGGVDDEAGSWGRPLGKRDELEREKRTLVKAIKEAEFDFAMGKLSEIDSSEMIAGYRARAIAVIKELDKLDGNQPSERGDSIRAQIEREVKARLAIEQQAASGKAAKRSKKKPKEATT
jgi:hypothetical protein